MLPALFRLAKLFCDFLALKSDLRRRAVLAYNKGDKRQLSLVISDIDKASQNLILLRRHYRDLWLEERSPFGLEIVEGRMGALGQRLEYLQQILTDHLEGRRPCLEELEFRHYSIFHSSKSPDYQSALWPEFFLHYSALASRNTIKWW